MTVAVSCRHHPGKSYPLLAFAVARTVAGITGVEVHRVYVVYVVPRNVEFKADGTGIAAQPR